MTTSNATENIILTASQAAAMLGVTRQTYNHYCRTVPGFPAKRLGRRWLVTRTALLAWVETQGAQM